MARLKVLIVDDEPDFLKLMGTRIESWGYDVIKASSGKEGIDAVKSESPNVVILDYMMPDMDGVEVLKEVRRIDKKIPVIMFTAYPDLKSMGDTEKLGVSSYIPKLSNYTDTLSTLKANIEMIEKRMGNKEG